MNTRTGTARIIRGVLLTLLLAASFVLNACSFAGYEGPGESEKMQATPQASPPDETMSQNDRLSTDERVHGTPLAGAPTTEEYGDSGVDASMIPAEDRYIIRSVGMRLQVSDVDKAVQGVRTQVASAKGIITSLQVSTDENVPVYRYEDAGAFSDGAPLGAYIIARVPVSSLDSFLTDVSKLGTVQRQAEDESDVTQEHIDLTARLETFKAQEKRLREFFDRAQKVDEMLAIEQELTRVRAEIESLTAQVTYLERQAAMATVTVELATRPPVVSPGGADWGFLDALTRGVRGLVSTINGLIVFVLSALPVLALMGGILALAIWAMRRQGHRRATGTATPASASEDNQENTQ